MIEFCEAKLNPLGENNTHARALAFAAVTVAVPTPANSAEMTENIPIINGSVDFNEIHEVKSPWLACSIKPCAGR